MLGKGKDRAAARETLVEAAVARIGDRLQRPGDRTMLGGWAYGANHRDSGERTAALDAQQAAAVTSFLRCDEEILFEPEWIIRRLLATRPLPMVNPT